MRIALLAPATVNDFRPLLDIGSGQDLPGGLICSMITDLVFGLVKKGHDVVLCTLDPRISRPQVYRGDHLTLFVGRYRKRGKLRAVTMFSSEINDMVSFLNSQPKCDIYNAHWTYEFALAALKTAPDKTIVTIRDWPATILGYYKNFYRFMRYLMSVRVFRNCYDYICNSAYIWQKMHKKYPWKRAVIIPHCIDMSKANFHPKHLRREHPRIIAVNNGFDRRKNGYTLMKAFQLVSGRRPDAELHLYGNGYEPEGAAQKWAESHKITGRIFYHGKVSGQQVLDAMREADLFIHPSLEESFGLVLIEAMISRTPVIGGRHSGAVPWVLHEGEAGVLADVTDPEDIASKALELLGNEEKWESLMTGAFDYAVHTFHTDTITQKYIEAYQRRLNGLSYESSSYSEQPDAFRR